MNCTLCQTHLNHRIDEQFFHCSSCHSYVKDSTFWLDPMAEKGRYNLHINDIFDPRYRDFVSPISDAIMNDYRTEHLGLDFGCGPGPVIAEVLKEAQYQVQLYDPFYHPDESYLNQYFDYIFSCEVFEHFMNPKFEIEKLMRILKPKGRLYIMTNPYDDKLGIAFENWYYRKDPTHVFIYTYATMRYISENFALDLVKMEKRLVVFEKK